MIIYFLPLLHYDATGGAVGERRGHGAQDSKQQSAGPQCRPLCRSCALVQVGDHIGRQEFCAIGDILSSSDVMETPLRAIPESKKSFLPSLSEKQKVRVNNVVKLQVIVLSLGGKDGARNQNGLDETAPCKEN